jgi:hypothetical protein
MGPSWGRSAAAGEDGAAVAWEEGGEGDEEGEVAPGGGVEVAGGGGVEVAGGGGGGVEVAPGGGVEVAPGVGVAVAVAGEVEVEGAVGVEFWLEFGVEVGVAVVSVLGVEAGGDPDASDALPPAPPRSSGAAGPRPVAQAATARARTKLLLTTAGAPLCPTRAARARPPWRHARRGSRRGRAAS